MNPILKYILKFAVPMVFDFIIKVSEDLVHKSDNTVDDKFVETLKENRDVIISTIGLL